MSASLMTLGLALLVGQENPSTTQPEPTRQLAELGFLVGRWQGSGEMEGVGRYTDEQVYSWNDYRTFLRSSYKMRVGDRVVWNDDSVTGWDADQQKVVTFTFGMDGSIGRASLVASRKNEWVFEGTSTSAKAPRAFRMTLTRVDDDTIRTAVEVRKADRYVPLTQTTHKRTVATPRK